MGETRPERGSMLQVFVRIHITGKVSQGFVAAGLRIHLEATTFSRDPGSSSTGSGTYHDLVHDFSEVSELPILMNSPGGPMRMLQRIADALRAKAPAQAMISEAISWTPK